MTLSVAGSVNYNAGTVVVEGVTAERYGDTFTAQGVSLSPGTNQIVAVYYGPMFTNAGHIATDTNGQEAATYRYTPFGRLTTTTGAFRGSRGQEEQGSASMKDGTSKTR
jgi:hypothetical protein